MIGKGHQPEPETNGEEKTHHTWKRGGGRLRKKKDDSPRQQAGKKLERKHNSLRVGAIMPSKESQRGWAVGEVRQTKMKRTLAILG